ncbi:MAG: GntR family transcriptional regulator [Proteobacteria bacterium]|nr:GntR family transcriptional regulator [Pseudomonadota bacterium]
MDARLQSGAPLVAGKLAEALGVSRYPIQQGLAHLVNQGLVVQPNGRGYAFCDSATSTKIREALARAGPSESSYMVIARDRLGGILPKSISETELSSRYGLTRSQLGPVLKRMAQEGWIRRGSGYGWEFTDIIDSTQSHADMYTFRMAIEPAAILSPTFQLDSAAVAALRSEQTQLRDGRLGRITSEELFEIGARFHETVIGFSSNPFFVNSLKQVNQLRRLVEYKAMAKPSHFMEQCVEHLALLDMLGQGERRQASEFLHRHLDIVRAVKRDVLESAARAPSSVPVHF